MRQLRSKASDLLALFSTEIKVLHIAERLQSLEASDSMQAAQEYMEERDFDVVGVIQNDQLVGYVARFAEGAQTCGDAISPLTAELLISDSTPLYDLLPRLAERQWVFVLGRPDDFSIVTRGDLQKAPFRMLLAGILSLFEMQMLRLVRLYFPNGGWQRLLSAGRVKKIREVFRVREDRNEQIDLADCLQFADKRTIILRSPEVRSVLGVSISSGEQRFKRVEALRDTIAHGQDLLDSRSWSDLFEIVWDAHGMLELLEGLPDA